MAGPAIGIDVILLILCVFFSAFFSAADTAYLAANHARLKAMAADGKRNAALAAALQDDYNRVMTTILVGNNLVNIAATAIATVLFTRLVGEIGATLSTVVMTIAILLFGEVSPKTYAREMPEKVAIATARPLKVLTVLLAPIDKLFIFLRKMVAGLVKHGGEESYIEEELMSMVEEAQSEGDIDAHESELIRSAIEFNDVDAISIVTPRVDITYIEDTASMTEAADIFRESNYSRIPVVHEDLDHVVGILHEKDFYNYFDRQKGSTAAITDIMVRPVWAPSSLKVSKLLKLFQESKTHMVILVDEFGGTEGIVTMEDVLEELVGEIYDEHDDVNDDDVLMDDGSRVIDGAMQLTDMLDEYGLADTYEADTVGGWAAEILERIPAVGDVFDEQGLHCVVTGMEKRRVTKVRVWHTESEKTETDKD